MAWRATPLSLYLLLSVGGAWFQCHCDITGLDVRPDAVVEEVLQPFAAVESTRMSESIRDQQRCSKEFLGDRRRNKCAFKRL